MPGAMISLVEPFRIAMGQIAFVFIAVLVSGLFLSLAISGLVKGRSLIRILVVTVVGVAAMLVAVFRLVNGGRPDLWHLPVLGSVLSGVGFYLVGLLPYEWRR